MAEEKGNNPVPPPGAHVDEKIVFLIRHAESRSNSSATDMKGAMGAVKSFKLPSGGQLKNGMALLKLKSNSELSQKGVQQVADVAQQMNMDNFLEKSGIERIYSSTMIRAMDTCDGLLGDSAERLSINIYRFHMICEQSHSEKLAMATFEQRVADVRRWLSLRKEKRICLVAHGTFLRYLVNPDVHFNNCTVYRIKMKIWQDNGKTRWNFEHLRKLYEPHSEIRETMPNGFMDPPMYDKAVDGDDDMNVAHHAGTVPRGSNNHSMGDAIDVMPSAAAVEVGAGGAALPVANHFSIEPEASAPPAGY